MHQRARTQAIDAPRPGSEYNIGAAAAASGVTAKMIRHYESLGLIPKATRTTSNYRVYTANDLHTLRFVRRARDLGFSMQEISTLLGLWRNKRRSSQQVRQVTQRHIDELDLKIAQLQSMRAALAHLAVQCHGDERPECPILKDLGTGSAKGARA